MTRRLSLAMIAALMLVAATSPTAQAATACGDLSTADARAAGERFMQRMLGSTQAREGMNRTMAAMMGADGVHQAYVMMGRSALGCPVGQAPAGMGRMMDAMGAMAGMMGGGAPYAGGMMGKQGYGMMGGQGVDHGWDASDTIIVLLIALLAVAAVAMLARRGGRSPNVQGPTSQPSSST